MYASSVQRSLKGCTHPPAPGENGTQKNHSCCLRFDRCDTVNCFASIAAVYHRYKSISGNCYMYVKSATLHVYTYTTYYKPMGNPHTAALNKGVHGLIMCN